MVSALNSRSSGPGWSPGRGQCCVLGQDTSHSQCLSPPRCLNGYRLIYFWGYLYDGLASHPGGSRNTPSRFMVQKTGDKRRPDWSLARMQTLPLILPNGL